MPEELKPCPACGADTIEAYSIKGTYQAACWNCHMRGPRKVEKSAAIAAWNSLHITPHITPNDVDCKGCPERRPGIVWSCEPPSVPGLYFQRWNWGDHWGEPDILDVGQSSIGRIIKSADRQWAGPIPMPQEHAK